VLLLWGLIAGIVIGWLSGGRLRRLNEIKLRAGWAVLGAMLIQFLIFPLGDRGPILPYATVPLHFASYALLALFLVSNLRHWPIAVMGVGLLLNLMAIAANGGYMPSSPAALRQAGLVEAAERLVALGREGNVVLMGPATHLNFLGDVLYIPRGVPFAAAFSVGDLLIGLGLAAFFPYGMRKRGD
jgi:hypothetical protein